MVMLIEKAIEKCNKEGGKIKDYDSLLAYPEYFRIRDAVDASVCRRVGGYQHHLDHFFLIIDHANNRRERSRPSDGLL